MKEAIILAKLAFNLNEVPVGCVIIEDGKIIASAHNENLTSVDPTAHAEIIAIRRAGAAKNSSRLDGCDMYVTLEPCPMCAHAISLSRIRRLYYGAMDEKSGGIDNGPKIFSSKSCHHKPEVYSGIMEIESSDLMKEFFRKKR